MSQKSILILRDNAVDISEINKKVENQKNINIINFQKHIQIKLGKRKKKDFEKQYPNSCNNSKSIARDPFLYDNLSNNNLGKKTTRIYNINNTIFENYKIMNIPDNENELLCCFNYCKLEEEYIKKNKKNDKLCEEKEVKLFDKQIFKILNLCAYYKIKLGGKIFSLDKKARIMNFIDENNQIIYIRFIYNVEQLKDVMKELNFESFYIDLNIYKEKEANELTTQPNPNSNPLQLLNAQELKNISSDSEYSTISYEDPAEIFSNELITEIFNESLTKILNEKNFRDRFVEKPKFLGDLSNNACLFYDKLKNKKFIFFTIYNEIGMEIETFASSNKTSIMYLFGPKGCSKTTFLLYLKRILNDFGKSSLYLNFNYLKNQSYFQIKKIIYSELLYLFKDIDEMNFIKQKKFFQNINDLDNGLLNFIFEFLSNLLNEIKFNERKMNIVIIIDNIYDNNNLSINALQNIINLIKSKSKYVKLILCGNGKFFNKKLINLYLIREPSDQFFILSINKSEIKEQENEDNDFLEYSLKFKHLYEENKNKKMNIIENLIENEKKNFSNYSFLELYFGEELNNKIITIQEIQNNQDLLSEIPLEFFEIKLVKNYENQDAAHFYFYNKIYKKAIRELIGSQVEEGILTKIIKDKKFSSTLFGICFEKKVTLLIKYNKMNLNNLFFIKNNIKEIEKINKLKEINYSEPIYNIEDKDKPILLIQENYFGPNYNLLILTKFNNKYFANFIQIEVDKKESEINNILDDLKNNYEIYKKNISKAFGIKLDHICIHFIFDLETQKENNYLNGVESCINKGINFYLFSNYNEYFLVYNKKLEEKLKKIEKYNPKIFDINNKKLKKTYSSSYDKKKLNKKKEKGFMDISNYFQSQ